MLNVFDDGEGFKRGEVEPCEALRETNMNWI